MSFTLAKKHFIPVYDINKSYLENAENGPFFHEEFPKRDFPKKSNWKCFLGYKLMSSIGIPAGPLLNSNWISFASKMGFDVLTYKTIRTHCHPSHPLPNSLVVSIDENKAYKKDSSISNMKGLTITNSFGMPSMSPDFLREDIKKAKDSLLLGQLLIVSVVGSKQKDISLEEDFCNAALMAKESGADVIEANLSCPNITDMSSALYLDSKSVETISSKISKLIAPIPLILKLGWIEDDAVLKSVLTSAERGGACAISVVNSVSMPVFHNGQYALTEKRKTSGICGAGIKTKALSLIKRIMDFKRKDHLNLSVLGVGGVVLKEDFHEFLDLGVDVVMSATGFMWDPYLAMHYHKSLEKN